MNAPARNYSWEPFRPGNTAALKSGARSPRMLRPLAEQLTASIAEVAPWTTQPTFGPAVEAWAWAEARVRLLQSWLDEHGVIDEHGQPSSALGALERAERAADRQRQQLGLSPTAWAALYRALAADPDGGTSGAESLKAVGRRLLEASAVDDTPPAIPSTTGEGDTDHG